MTTLHNASSKKVSQEYLTEEEFNTQPLSWYEEVALLRQQQHQAFLAFFTEHNYDSKYQWLHKIPQERLSPLLICDWCKDEATHFQKIPARALFCTSCAKKLRKYRHQEFLKQKPWKAGEIVRWMEAANKK